jgi:hypothetical protein
MKAEGEKTESTKDSSASEEELPASAKSAKKRVRKSIEKALKKTRLAPRSGLK